MAEDGLACFERVLEMNPEDDQNWHNKAFALREMGRTEEALLCYDRALKLNPTAVNTLNDKGAALGNLGRFEEALRCFEQVLEIEEGNADARERREVALKALGRSEKAPASFDLVFDPRNATARWRGAVKPGRGLAACERAERLYKEHGPENPLFQAHIGHCQACRAKYSH